MAKTVIVETTWTENTDPRVIKDIPMVLKSHLFIYGLIDAKVVDDDDGA